MAKAIGTVTHYFDHLGVAVIKLEKSAKLKQGDTIKFEGHGADFSQSVESMQIDHKEVSSAGAGDDFGMKVDKPVKEGTKVLPVK